MRLSAIRSILPGSSASGSPAAWSRTLISLFLLIAFSVQTYIAQTHIHGSVSVDRLVAAYPATSVVETRHDPGLPSEDDQANCLLCQAVAHAHAFSVPVLAALSLPVQTVLAVVAPFSSRIAVVRFVGHGWQQRAPPHS